jgi:DNA-binding NarL/FixJ family response regulator
MAAGVEREILVLVAQGRANTDIAQRLFLSPTTVKSHISHTMAKLDAHDRAGLVVFAYESGLASPPLP